MPAAPAAPKEKPNQEPQSAAARRAAGLPDQADPQAADAAEQDAAQVAASPGAVTTVPGGENVEPDSLSREELDLIRRLRSDRGQEIMEHIRQAPVGLGTDQDPYALVHQRGCPFPQNTETYVTHRPDGRAVTVVRCIQCGAQNNIDH